MTVDPFNPKSTPAEDFMAGSSGYTAAKWPKNGHDVEGTVIGWDEPYQQSDYRTGELLFFEGRELKKSSELVQPQLARPAMQLPLHLQCEATGITWETNQYIEKPLPDDDGKRTVYVKARLHKALTAAIRESGGKLEKGAHVKITRTGAVKAKVGVAFTFDVVWTPASANGESALDALAGGEDEEEVPF